jgi:hypothetical protein
MQSWSKRDGYNYKSGANSSLDMGEDLWQTLAKLVHMGSLATLEESKEGKRIDLSFFFLHNKIDVLTSVGAGIIF